MSTRRDPRFAPSDGPRPHAPPRRTWYGPCKAALDFLLALALLLLAAPLLLVLGVLVKLTSRGPVFYSQTRLGKRGRPFTVYKLRTMTHDCERESGPQWSRPGDPRVTRLGRFLRKTHLDELPQLWNVLRGDMSLVGPRPERPEFFPSLEEALPQYPSRLRVRPGVTGLAQTLLPADTDLESVRKKLSIDLHYVDNHGPWLDLRILIATPLLLLGLSPALLRRIFFLPAPASPALRAQAAPAPLPAAEIIAKVPALSLSSPGEA